MSGRVAKDRDVRVKGSNPAWLDRDREDRGGEGSKVAAKVRRYRAGQAPAWAPGDDGNESDGEEEELGAFAAGPGRRAPARAVVVKPARGGAGGAEPGERKVAAPVVIRARPAERTKEEEEIAAENDRRRAEMRARALAQQQQEEEMPYESEDDSFGAGLDPDPPPAFDGGVQRAAPRPKSGTEEEEEDDEEEDEEGSSSWETDTDASDSDEPTGRKMIKPLFVPKRERETVAERERVEAEMDAEWEGRARQREIRANESRQLAQIEVDRENQIEEAEANAEGSDVDTSDEADPEGDYEKWVLREMERMRVYEEQREQYEKEQEELAMLRAMPEDEKEEWLRKNRPELYAPKAEKERKKMNFMQKYYHKGAFFQEAPDDPFGTAGTDDIYKRDFSVATGEDKVDKSALPKAMQVRKDKFGKVGQTKWTHLSAEDTTYAGRDKGEFNAWADKNNPNLRKLEKKRAGMKGFEVKKHLE
jgi:microfibrillar-associated protein 1